MIFFWLGAWALMLYGLRETQMSFARLARHTSQNSFLKIAAEVSPKHSLKHGLDLYRRGSKHEGLLLMSFSFLGAWLVFLLASLFLNVQGVLFLAVGALGFVNFINFPRRKDFFGVFWGAGIFLMAAEFLLRQSTVLQSLLGETEFAFMMVDGRAPAVLALASAGLIGGLIFRQQFWSLTLGLSLLAASYISFNGAMALYAGEAMGILLLWAWRARGDGPLKIWTAISAAGIFVGFFLTWYAKEFFGWGSSFGMSGATERFDAFLWCALLITLIHAFFQMVAGHLVAPKRP